MTQSEAFARVKIDKALEASAWDLLDGAQVMQALHGGNGRADFVLISPAPLSCGTAGKSG